MRTLRPTRPTWEGEAPAEPPRVAFARPRRLGGSLALPAAPRIIFAISLFGLIAREPTPVHAESFVDFLHIEANEGGSSGGHAALRLDDRVYHFEHVAPGLLRLRRDRADDFVHAYATLANRPIHVQRLALTDGAFRQLRDTLSRRQLAQAAQLELRAALRRDVALLTYLEQMHPDPHGNAALELPAAGLFVARRDSGNAPDELDARTALRALRASIERKYGSDFLPSRASELVRRIKELPLRSADDCGQDIDPDTLPRCTDPVSVRWQQLATAARALDILNELRPLHAGSYQSRQDPDLHLSDLEVVALERHAAQLESALVDLMGSSRPDWAFGFIVGMARLATMRASAAQHRLIVIGDARAAAAITMPIAAEPALVRLLPAIETDMTRDWHALVTSVLGTDEFREADYTALELATQRVIAVRRTIDGWRPDSLAPLLAGAAVDEGSAWPTAVPTGAEVERARSIAETYDAALAQVYGYNLLTHNCVTALTALLNETTEAAARSTPLTTDVLSFIPFVAPFGVATRYTVVAEDLWPSHRQQLVARMAAEQSPWAVSLRESNTLTSQLYQPWSHDSTFLFFTSDAMWNRPLLGFTNLLVAAGATAFGMFQAPLAGPQPFVAGVRGMLYSLPELFFVNIRKGTFAYVARWPRKRSHHGSAEPDPWCKRGHG